jgi:hypothetical protein
VEFHKSGWAHFHLLLEAEFIPFVELCRLWGRNRPKSAPAWPHSYAESLKGVAPEFGTCQISKGDKSRPFADAKHAACYALKYMMKQPEYGYPEWVFDAMNAGSRIRLYESSRKLLPTKPTKKHEADGKGEVAGDEHPAECFCESCRESATPTTARVRRTVEERLAECGKRAAVLEVTERKDAAGAVIASNRRFVRMLEVLFVDVLMMVGCEDADTRFVRLQEGDYLRFALHRGPKRSVVGGEVNSGEVARFAEFDAWNASGGVV